jgi:hypothetical protein
LSSDIIAACLALCFTLRLCLRAPACMQVSTSARCSSPSVHHALLVIVRGIL